MKKLRFAVFGLVLAAGATFAVSTLVAQTRSERPRAMIFDGGGGQLGVTIADLDTEALKSAAGATSGVRIEEVTPESAAARAGLKQGDIVVEVDGERVRSARQFTRLMQETPAGKRVTLGVVREGGRQSVDVTPETRTRSFDVDTDRFGRDIARGLRDLEPRMRELEPRLRELEPRLRERLREIEPRLREFHNGPMTFDFDGFPRLETPRGRLGVQIGELTPQLAEYFGAKDGGVLVSGVTKDSPADKAGLKAGDVITALDGDRVGDTADLVDGLRLKTGDVTLGILRDKQPSTLNATIPTGESVRRRPVEK
ncbi:MAG: PDZ domain-containing protein [Acidobacteria bacterium]|nr:PDZ domain-containing protein [Acidobacteriota bacterium]